MKEQQLQRQYQEGIDVNKIKVKTHPVTFPGNNFIPDIPVNHEAKQIEENRRNTAIDEMFTSFRRDKDYLSAHEKQLLTKYSEGTVTQKDAEQIEKGLAKEGVYSFRELIAQNDPKMVAEFLKGLKEVKEADAKECDIIKNHYESKTKKRNTPDIIRP